MMEVVVLKKRMIHFDKTLQKLWLAKNDFHCGIHKFKCPSADWMLFIGTAFILLLMVTPLHGKMAEPIKTRMHVSDICPIDEHSFFPNNVPVNNNTGGGNNGTIGTVKLGIRAAGTVRGGIRVAGTVRGGTNGTVKSRTNITVKAGIRAYGTLKRRYAPVKPFYIQTSVDASCTVYICYLSQLDENYKLSNKQLQIRAGLTFRNLVNNEIAERCNPKNHAKFKRGNIPPQPNAWHGMKVELKNVTEKEGNKTYEQQFIHIQTSFSKEHIHLPYDKLASARGKTRIRIHFGTLENPLFTEYQNTREEVLLPKQTSLARIPPLNALHGVSNIRNSFQANAGAWLIPMDMAQLETFGSYNNSEPNTMTNANMTDRQSIFRLFDRFSRIGRLTFRPTGMPPTRMLYFVANCTGNDMPDISIVMVKKKKENYTVEFGPKKVSSTTTAKTITENRKECRTQFVNAKAAVIRDRFADLSYACPDQRNPSKCQERVDYAIRLGCIECKPGITAEEQNEFLETLRKWLNEQMRRLETDFVYDELDQWKGTQLVAFLNEPDQKQTIQKIEPGGFRYVTLPEDWGKNDIYMLVHDCGAYGQFASAVHKGKVGSSPLEAKLNWEKKFEFLEECEFEQTVFVKKSYKVNKVMGEANFAMEYTSNQIHFGTYKWNARTRQKDNYTLSAEEIQAHKFKYGLTDPMRDNKFVGDAVNDYERVKRWGRYIEQPDLMYQPYNHTPHKYDIGLKKYKKEDLLRGKMMTDEEFENANVDVTVAQMNIQCGDIHYMTTRVNAIQKFDYKVLGQKVEPKPELVLQTKYYTLDNLYAEPGKDKGQNCVHDEECLADVHIFKYKLSVGK